MASSGQDEDVPFSYYGTKEENSIFGKGYCLVLANFTNDLRRYENDIENIVSFFGDTLKYKIVIERNKTKAKFIDILKKTRDNFQTDCNADYDRLFVFILSHGSKAGILMCLEDGITIEEKDDKPVFVTIETITGFFDHGSIPKLSGYPKCIMIQACRGSNITRTAGTGPSFKLDDPCIEDGSDDKSEGQNKRNRDPQKRNNIGIQTPSYSNILVGYSCLHEELCLFNELCSLYIGDVIDTFKQHYKEFHLLDMLVEVTRRVEKRKTTKEHLPINYLCPKTFAKIEHSGSYKDVTVVTNTEAANEVVFESMLFKQVIPIGLINEHPVDIKADEHEIKFTLKSHSVNANLYESDTISVISFEKEVLPIVHNETLEVEIKDACVIDAATRIVIGCGEMKYDEHKVTSISQSIEPLPESREYKCKTHRVTHEGSQQTMYLNAEEVNGANAVIVKKDEDVEIIQHRGTILQESDTTPPVIVCPLHQLPVFETTFKKQFYLSMEAEPRQKRSKLKKELADEKEKMDKRQQMQEERGNNQDKRGAELDKQSKEIRQASNIDGNAIKVGEATGGPSDSSQDSYRSKEKIPAIKPSRKSKVPKGLSCLGFRK